MKSTKANLRLVVGFAVILLLACALVMSGMLAKYRTEMVIANEVNYQNQLADSFKLLDQPIKQLEDGSYAVDETKDAEPTNGYTFKLIPGITLPAAPYIEVQGKTEIPAYLFVEVQNTGDTVLTFDTKWMKLSVTGKKGGDVYAYDNGAALTGDGDSDEVLTMPTFTINKLSKTPLTDESEIKVYAYLLQKVGDKSAADTYADAPNP